MAPPIKNPGYAPATDNCKKCKNPVKKGQMGIICDLCKWWFHASCVQLVKKEYEMLGKMDDKVRWFCKDCDEKIETLEGENGKVMKMTNCKQKTITLRGKLEELAKKVNRIENEMRHTLEKEISKVRVELEHALKQEIANEMGEQTRKIEKKL